MKFSILLTALTLGYSSLFAQKKIHDSTLVFGKWIYTDLATGRKWGGDSAVVSKKWNCAANFEQLTFGELYLNNATHDTLRNVVFFFVFKGIKDANEVRTVDTAARTIVVYKPADVAGFHIAQSWIHNENCDTGLFFSVSKKGLQTMTDGKADFAQVILFSNRVSLAQSIGSSYTPFYYRFDNATAFENLPQFGNVGFVYKFKNKFTKIFEHRPDMQKLIKVKNYSEDRAGMVAAFTDYANLTCPYTGASAKN